MSIALGAPARSPLGAYVRSPLGARATRRGFTGDLFLRHSGTSFEGIASRLVYYSISAEEWRDASAGDDGFSAPNGVTLLVSSGRQLYGLNRSTETGKQYGVWAWKPSTEEWLFADAWGAANYPEKQIVPFYGAVIRGRLVLSTRRNLEVFTVSGSPSFSAPMIAFNEDTNLWEEYGGDIPLQWIVDATRITPVPAGIVSGCAAGMMTVTMAASGYVPVRVGAVAVTVNAGTDVFTAPGHDLVDGSRFMFRTSGTLPAPLSIGTDYFARDVSGDTFKVALTLGGSAVNITSTGTGVHEIRGDYDKTASWSFTGTRHTYHRSLSWGGSESYALTITIGSESVQVSGTGTASAAASALRSAAEVAGGAFAPLDFFGSGGDVDCAYRILDEEPDNVPVMSGTIGGDPFSGEFVHTTPEDTVVASTLLLNADNTTRQWVFGISDQERLPPVGTVITVTDADATGTVDSASIEYRMFLFYDEDSDTWAFSEQPQLDPFGNNVSTTADGGFSNLIRVGSSLVLAVGERIENDDTAGDAASTSFSVFPLAGGARTAKIDNLSVTIDGNGAFVRSSKLYCIVNDNTFDGYPFPGLGLGYVCSITTTGAITVISDAMRSTVSASYGGTLCDHNGKIVLGTSSIATEVPRPPNNFYEVEADGDFVEYLGASTGTDSASSAVVQVFHAGVHGALVDPDA